MLENNRFLHYKDAASWMSIHDKYGDGNVFDVLMGHIDQMAHTTALVDTFGPNPSATIANIEAMVKKEAASLSPVEKVRAEAVLKDKFRPMMDTIQHNNPMNPHSMLGAVITGTGNILTGAQLGAASLLAMPGDFAQTMAVRLANGMPATGGLDFYLKSLISDPMMERIATQSGFVMDQAVMSTYAATRFTGLATVGPQVTRRIADAAMRASLLAGHTDAARWATQSEFMGLLHRSMNTPFDDLPFKMVFERYGIDKNMWDEVRAGVKPWNAAEGVNLLRPLDILQSSVTNSRDVFQRFQGMILEEARTMIPESTIEASVMLRGTTRPDTLRGALLYSFSMYKNFPVSFWMIYGRLALTNPSAKGRLGFTLASAPP